MRLWPTIVMRANNQPVESVSHDAGSMSRTVAAVRSSNELISLGKRLRIVLSLGRPRTAVPGLIAYALGVGYSHASWSIGAVAGALIALLLAFTVNIHNSTTDLLEDSVNLPGRVEQVHLLGVETTRRIAVALGSFMVFLSILINPLAAIYVLCSVLLMYQYSARPTRAKDKPILGLLAFAQAVCVPYMLGILLEPLQTVPWIIPPALARLLGFALPNPAIEDRAVQACVLLLLVALWFTAKGTFKNLVDYYGDRASGLRTSASVFSTRSKAFIPVALLTTVAYLAPLALPIFHFPGKVAWVSLWTLPAAFNVWRLGRTERGTAANSLLRIDMVISSAFIASLLLVLFPRPSSVMVVIVSTGIIVASDLLRFDSRKTSDVQSGG
jgi:4-hydroxybenzoate polyprenyltransferase